MDRKWELPIFDQALFDKWRNTQRREIFSPGKAKKCGNALCISRIFNGV